MHERTFVLKLLTCPLLICLASLSQAADNIATDILLRGVTPPSGGPVLVETLDAQGNRRINQLPPPHGFEDPITVPPDSERQKVFSDAYVENIEAYYLAKTSASKAFVTWLKAHPDIRRTFWLAFSPQFDNAFAAVEVLDALRQHNATATEKYSHLAIAMAIVHDSSNALHTSRVYCIWGVNSQQFSPQRKLLEVFDYLTSPKVQPKLALPIDQLPWPILVHLVDLDIDNTEIDWAWKNCAGSRKDLAAVYQTVPYDHDKRNRSTPKLGILDYTLVNLRTKGGVCGDQAHYTSRLAKCFGVPSMKVLGMNRHGGLHAWAGFLTNAGGRPLLEFTGRYQSGFYYTGDIFDPQTRTVILDREVAMLYDGLSLSFSKFQDSDLLARAALKLINVDAPRAIRFAHQAIDLNTFNPTAWRLLSHGSAVGSIAKKESNLLFSRMLKDLAGHPDLTFDCLKRFMSAVPEQEVDERQNIYTKTYALYSKRPDLQIRMRQQQCEELVKAKREADALKLSLQTCTVNAKEGGLILPLVTFAVESAKTFAASNPNFKLRVVKQALANIETDFPPNNGSAVSSAYLELKKLMESL